MSGSKAGRGVGRGGGRGGTNKGKLDSRDRSKGLPSQANMTCNYCQKPGHIRPNCPEPQCFKGQGWGYEAFPCSSEVSTPKENGDKKKKDESDVMAVIQEADSEVTVDIMIDENDGRGATCFPGWGTAARNYGREMG